MRARTAIACLLLIGAVVALAQLGGGSRIVQSQQQFRPSASTPAGLVVDYYVHMATGANLGDQITGLMLTNGTSPASSWTLAANATNFYLGGHSNNLHTPVTVGAVTFPVDFTNNTLLNTLVSGSSYKLNLSGTKITTSGFLVFGYAPSTFVLKTVMLYDVSGGKTAYVQINPGGSYQIRLNSTETGGTNSSYVTIVRGKPYWFSFFMDAALGQGVCEFNLYNTTNWALDVGLTNYSGPTNRTITDLNFGIGGGDAGYTNVWEHVIVGLGANAARPLGP